MQHLFIKPLFLLRQIFFARQLTRQTATFGLIALSSQGAFALGIESAPIKTVTLYPNAALVERTVSVSAGQRVVTLDNLPANFDIAQLQVNASNQIQVGIE